MKYVIVGGGVAGTTAAQSIRKTDPDGTITIISDEPFLFYSRIRLIEYLTGSLPGEKLIIKKQEWYTENRIEILKGVQTASVDPDARKVTLSNGDSLEYDRLLLATGGCPFVPPISGAKKRGVFTLRTLEDAKKIVEYAKSHKRTAIIGGGLLGLESGASLMKCGSRVSVVENCGWLLPRQMDRNGAAIFKSQMESMGLSFFLSSTTREISGNQEVEAVLLDDGSRVNCDMVLISAGIRPNLRLAKEIGLDIRRGVVVNDRMQTSRPDIYAAGDLSEHRGTCYGIWLPAQQQGDAAGINMAGGEKIYNGTTMSNTLKVAGVDLCSAGDIDADCKKESLVFRDDARYIYKKLVLENNRIVGTILYGDAADRMKVMKAMEAGKDVSNLKEELGKGNFHAL